MNALPRRILRIHAVFLVVLTIALTIGGFVGLNTATGPFAWVHDIPMALVGLLQAYLLMLVVGICLWLGAGGDRLWRWSLIAIAAHSIPLIAIFAMYGTLAAGGFLGTANVSYLIHGVWITIELISLGLMVRQRRLAGRPLATAHA